MNNVEKVVVRNTETGEVGEIRRSLFENDVFNPDGLLIEIEDNRSGCVDCGVEPFDTDEDSDPDLEDELDEEED